MVFPARQVIFDVIGDLITNERQREQLVLDDRIVGLLGPALIVIALGINDAVLAYRTDFRATYGLLIDSLPKSPIALATLAPVDTNFPVAKILNPSTIKSIDAAIIEIAASRRAPIIDLGAIVGIESRDGIHPTESSYHHWITVIVAGIENALKCDGALSREPH
jgi:hypothetical protein